MERYLFMVRSNNLSFSEEEFNNWYNEVHLVDVMGTPGFVRAERYWSEEMGSYGAGRHIAMYYIETDDIDKTMATLVERSNEALKKGRMSPLLSVVSLDVLRPIYPTTE